MSAYSKITKNLDDVERKLTKGNKIAAKGTSLGYRDAIKLGAKSNSIVYVSRQILSQAISILTL
jgi:hypothetical protein